MKLKFTSPLVLSLLTMACDVVPSTTRAKDLNVILQTTDTNTARAASVQIEMPLNDATSRPVSGGYQRWTVKLADPNDGPLVVNIADDSNYTGREITIRQDTVAGWSTRTQVTLHIWVAHKQDGYDYSYLYKGLTYLDDGTDRGLAYYEAPFAKDGMSTYDMYSIGLRYDYARAAKSACMSLGYDTCGIAQKLFGDMAQDFDSYQDIYSKAKITKLLISTALADLKYADYKQKIESKDYAGAYQTIQTILDEASNQHDNSYLKLGLTPDKLQADAAYTAQLQHM